VEALDEVLEEDARVGRRLLLDELVPEQDLDRLRGIEHRGGEKQSKARDLVSDRGEAPDSGLLDLEACGALLDLLLEELALPVLVEPVPGRGDDLGDDVLGDVLLELRDLDPERARLVGLRGEEDDAIGNGIPPRRAEE